MLPSGIPKLPHRPSGERVSWCLETSPSWLPSWNGSPPLTLLSLFLSFIFYPTSFQWEWAAFLGAWCPLPVQKLFCGICSVFKWSFDEFVGEKMVSWSYSSAILGLSWMLNFKPAFSLSYFTFIKRLFSSSSLSAIRMVSSAYLRLLIFLPAVLIPACASSSLAFHMMYSVYKLNKQGDNIQPWCIPFPIWNQSVAPCPVLSASSWPANRFHRRQVRWSGIPISWRIFQFVVIHTVKGFTVVNEAEVRYRSIKRGDEVESY